MITWLEENKSVAWTITFIGFFSIFWISNLTIEPQISGPKSPLAVIYHFSAFFLLALFLYISTLERRLEWKKTGVVLLILVIYAILDELHQYFVPGRFCSIYDVYIDSLGILLASLVYLVITFWKKS